MSLKQQNVKGKKIMNDRRENYTPGVIFKEQDH